MKINRVNNLESKARLLARLNQVLNSEPYPDSDEVPDPAEIRKMEINNLVNRFKDDPDLLDQVLLKLRKDKIDKIKNR